MKIYELFETSQNTGFKLFVDLDGVLVDFEKGVSAFMADDMSDKGYKNLPVIQGYAMGNNKQSRAFWKKVEMIEESDAIALWTNLGWMSDGKKLWGYINGYNPVILSSPGTSSRHIIEAGKKIWIDRHLSPKPSYIFEPDKFKHAKGKPGIQHILIDDSKKKLDPWEAAGGIGIFHTSASDTIKQLKNWGF